MANSLSDGWSSTLPDTLLLAVYALLDAQSLSRAARTCRRWYALSCTDALWKR